MIELLSGLKRKITQKRWNILASGTQSAAIERHSKAESQRLAQQHELINREHETRRLKLTLSSIHYPVLMLAISDMIKHVVVEIGKLVGAKVSLPWVSLGQLITETFSLIPAVAKAIKQKKYVGAAIRFFIYALIGSVLIAGFLVSAATMELIAPILFGIAFTVITALSCMAAYAEYKNFKDNPWKAENTLARITRNSRYSKAAVFVVLLPLLFVFFFVPPAHVIVGFTLVAVIGTLAISRVVKHYKQRKAQMDLLREFIDNDIDPYKVLGIDRESLLNHCESHEEYRWKIKAEINKKYKNLSEQATGNLANGDDRQAVIDSMSLVEKAYQLLRKDAIRKTYDGEMHMRELALDPEFRISRILHYRSKEQNSAGSHPTPQSDVPLVYVDDNKAQADKYYKRINSFRYGWRLGFTRLMRVRSLYRLRVDAEFNEALLLDSSMRNALSHKMRDLAVESRFGHWKILNPWYRWKAKRALKKEFLDKKPRLATVGALLKTNSGFKRWTEICGEMEQAFNSTEVSTANGDEAYTIEKIKVSVEEKKQFATLISHIYKNVVFSADRTIIHKLIAGGLADKGSEKLPETMEAVLSHPDDFNPAKAIKHLSPDDRIKLEQMLARYGFANDGHRAACLEAYTVVKRILDAVSLIGTLEELNPNDKTTAVIAPGVASDTFDREDALIEQANDIMSPSPDMKRPSDTTFAAEVGLFGAPKSKWPSPHSKTLQKVLAESDRRRASGDYSSGLSRR